MKYAKSITELIGNTPLVELSRYEVDNLLEATILAKLEYFNPAGSAKDRIALNMIEDAEKKKLIKPGALIIEPTSGNTGIGLACVCAAKGYHVLFTMPETMSIERRNLLKAYGAKVVLTEGSKGMQGAVDKAKEIAAETKGSFIPSQFDNPKNPEAHFNSTGPEIWHDTDGKVDIFVAGIGTGGTLSGTGKYLKSRKDTVKIVGVEPLSSPLLTHGLVGQHKIQGIGANFIPKNLDKTVYDEIIDISDMDALETGRILARLEGMLVGISSGAAVMAAKILAQRPENKGKIIVALLPDTGERYLSTPSYLI